MGGKKKKRRLRRWLIRAGLGLGLLLIALFAAKGYIIDRWIKPIVAGEISERSGLDVQIDSILVDFAGVEIRGLRCSGGEPVSSLERLDMTRLRAEVSFFDMLRGKRNFVRDVRVESLSVDVNLDRRPLFPESQVDAANGAAEPLKLPPVLFRNGSIRVRRQGETFFASGCDVSLRYPNVDIFVATGGGNWRLPNASAIEFPISTRIELRGGERSPFGVLWVDALRMGDKPIAVATSIELRDEKGDFRVRGSSPHWGVADLDLRLDDERLSLTAVIEESRLSHLLPLASIPTQPFDAELHGPVSLDVPLLNPELWRASFELQARDFYHESLGIEADVMHLVLRKSASHEFAGEAHGIGFRRGDSPDVEFLGRFVGEMGSDSGESWWQVDDLRVFLGSDSEVRGTLRLVQSDGDVRVDTSRLYTDGLHLEDLSAWVPELGDMSGSIVSDMEFRGGVDPTTWDASGSVQACVRGGQDGEDVLLDMMGSMRGCQLVVHEGLASRGQNWVHFGVEIEARKDGELAIRMRELFGDYQGWPVGMAGPVELELFAGVFKLNAEEINAFDGSWKITGAGSVPGPVHAELELADMEIGNDFLQLLPNEMRAEFAALQPSSRISLQSVADLHLFGNRVQDVWIESWLEMNEAAITVGKKRFRDVKAKAYLSLDAEKLTFEITRLQHGQDILSQHGEIPIEWSPYPRPRIGEEAIASGGISTEDIGAYVVASPAQIRQIGGAVDANFKVASVFQPDYSIADFKLDSLIQLKDGVVKLHGSFPAIEDIQSAVRVRKGKLQIRRLSAKIAGSQVNVLGDVDYSTLSGEEVISGFDLELSGKNLLLIRRPELRVRGNLDLKWKGDWDSSRVQGLIRLTRSYYLSDVRFSRSGATLPFDLFHLLDKPFRDARLDVRILAKNSFIIRNNVINTRGSADLRLAGTGRDPILTGVLSADTGIVRVGNTSLKIQSAVVTFQESDPYNPRLQITLSQRISEYEVTVSVSGTMESPEVIFNSVPPLENDRLLLLVATGYTIDRVNEEGAERLAAIEAAKFFGNRVYSYFSRGDDPLETSFWDRFRFEAQAKNRDQESDLYRFEFTVLDSVTERLQDEIFVQSERDFYGDYSINVGWRFEVR